jgi:TonB family protein
VTEAAVVEPDQGLSRASFERVVTARHEELEHCFQRRLASGKAVGGDLELNVTIAAEGTVLRAGVASSQRDRPLEQCLSQVVSRWRFPRTGEATMFSLPLVFDVGDLQSRR